MVRCDFRQPVISVALRHSRELAFRVTVAVPETSMHKDYLSMARQNNIGPSRQVLPVESKSIAKLVDEPPNNQLRTRVGASNQAHPRGTLL
jgi:hypothetical protein